MRRARAALCLAASALLAVPGSPATAPPSQEASPRPKIRFEKTTHDFGPMRSDEKRSFEWTYFNDGDAPLTILETRPSCGCTASVSRDKAVPPGAGGTLSVTFDGAGQSGSIRKSLAVLSDDPVQGIVLLTILAQVTPAGAPTVPGDHPPVAGQSMLMGSCGKCHAEPATGKSEESLWAAVCAMCHGREAEGGRAVSLRDAGYLASHDDRALREVIAYGTTNPRMPGFSDVMGGPLSDAQIDSLVRTLRRWGPLATGR